ncbi:hypothetical protein Mgra_00001189 [Meloidogyne graminicola]|uniref:Uncharacterized protein n=1 Tax=Meloidogyne graminicola TaxID=189291 RepID=A0A8T0A1B0_9BILA|nr:hypothetical protein Mgra_00001189 [Meloidogyne graminicola]
MRSAKLKFVILYIGKFEGKHVCVNILCRRFIPTFIILYLSIFFIFSASKPLIQQKQIAISGAGSRITPVSSSSSSGSGGTKSIKLSLNKLKEQRREKFASILEEDEDFGMSKETKEGI